MLQAYPCSTSVIAFKFPLNYCLYHAENKLTILLLPIPGENVMRKHLQSFGV